MVSFYTSYFIKLFYFVRHPRFKSDFLQNEVFIHFRVWNNIYLLHLSNANLFDKITVSFYILYVIKFLLPATVYSNFISSKTKSPANCSSLSSRKLVKFTHSSYIFKLDFLKNETSNAISLFLIFVFFWATQFPWPLHPVYPRACSCFINFILSVY